MRKTKTVLNDVTQINSHLPVELKRRVKRRAVDEGRTLKAILIDALQTYVDKPPRAVRRSAALVLALLALVLR